MVLEIPRYMSMEIQQQVITISQMLLFFILLFSILWNIFSCILRP